MIPRNTCLLSVLSLCGLVFAVGTFADLSQRNIQPVNDERCLSRITGGFSLSTCDSTAKTRATFQEGGHLAFGAECVGVPVSTQDNDPWRSGTRLKAVSCTQPEATETNWRYDSAKKRIQAASRSDKCLSITGSFGAMRAVIMDCNQSGVTQWELN